MSTSPQPHEAGIRTVHIRGVAVSISRQKGAALFVVPASYSGRRIKIQGLSGDSNTWRVTSYATVEVHQANGKTQYVAKTIRLIPGNYYADCGSLHGFDLFSIDANFVTQIHWTH